MACHAAIIDKALTLKMDMSVEYALKAMKKKNVDCAPVLDPDKRVAGIFSYKILMKNLLPVQIAMKDGSQMDIQISAAPGIVKRLKNIQLVTLDQVMERQDISVVYPETPTWEGVKMMVQTDNPLIVIDPESEKYVGFISQNSMHDELERLKESE